MTSRGSPDGCNWTLADPMDPRKWWQPASPRPYLPHAPGVTGIARRWWLSPKMQFQLRSWRKHQGPSKGYCSTLVILLENIKVLTAAGRGSSSGWKGASKGYSSTLLLSSKMLHFSLWGRRGHRGPSKGYCSTLVLLPANIECWLAASI